ncbi:ABC transporter permease [Hydrogenophaga sp. 5NK40-0174]|uniref:ABC transporter permease n=1 Tax=Hydrogenophaga sp. 5NK40-0174 TaxID=3127649 RepID=UPI00310B2450
MNTTEKRHIVKKKVPVWRRLLSHRLSWPLTALCLLLVTNAAFNPTFLSIEWRGGHLYGSLIDILNRAAPLILVSLGMTLVIAMRGIDVSVGAVVAIAAAVGAWMIGGSLDGETSRFPLPVAIVGALVVAMLCGLWNGLLVAGLGMQPIIATLILMVAGRGIAQLITDGQIITVYYPPFFFLGGGYWLGLPFSLFVVAGILAMMSFALSRTALGVFVQAVGVNPSAARGSGIRARQLVLGAYVFCGFCAGLAGLLISSNVKSADGNNAGLLMELDAILAVTLGGTALTGGRFSLMGTVIGALIIQTLTYAIYSMGVPPEINMVVKAAVVFVVMLLQSPAFRSEVWALVRRPSSVEVAQ